MILILLTLSWRRYLSHRNQSIYLHRKSIDCSLYDRDLRHERVNQLCGITCLLVIHRFFVLWLESYYFILWLSFLCLWSLFVTLSFAFFDPLVKIIKIHGFNEPGRLISYVLLVFWNSFWGSVRYLTTEVAVWSWAISFFLQTLTGGCNYVRLPNFELSLSLQIPATTLVKHVF